MTTFLPIVKYNSDSTVCVLVYEGHTPNVATLVRELVYKVTCTFYVFLHAHFVIKKIHIDRFLKYPALGVVNQVAQYLEHRVYSANRRSSVRGCLFF